MSGYYNLTSWSNPIEDLVDLGNTVVDGARDVAEQAVGVAEIVGEGIVDGATLIGEGVVTAGEGVAKWSVNAVGDAVEWSKTSYAEVAEWTENAAGLVANFCVEAYQVAYDAVELVYKALLDYLSETLPELGGLDPNARKAAAYLMSEPVARGIEALADAAGCVLTFGIKLKAGSSVNLGIYACGSGWGFFLDSKFGDLDALLSGLSPGIGVAAQVTMVFGPVSRASGAKAIKLGLGVKANPTKKLAATIGGVVLMEASAPPLFLGLRYAMELDVDLFGKQTVDDAGKLKWKVKTALPKPNGDFVTDAYGAVAGAVEEIGWEDVTNGLSSQATHFDAALRAHADPASADRIKMTALAVSMSPFKPRYYGEVRTAKGQTVVGTGQGALGLDIVGDRRVVQIVSGLTDPTAVSLEAVGEPPLYWCAQANGDMTLVPYDKSRDLSGTTFRMLRGLSGPGASFAVAADGPTDPRHIVATRVRGGIVTPTPVLCAARLSGIEAPSKPEATFLLDRPADQPDAASSLLRPGQYLLVNQARRAPNGMFALILGSDGRLAVRRRGSGPLSSPTAWMPYQPGLIQDQVNLWAWASPAVAAAPGYHAIVTQDGRLAVRAGASPASAGATLWQTEVLGGPGPCFLAVTNQGVVTLIRGMPDAPGEIIWSSVLGAHEWPIRRRQVVLRTGGRYIAADNGGGVHKPEALTQEPAQPVRVSAPQVGGWEAFELQDLCTGAVALRAQGRRFVGVENGSTGLTCLRDHVTTRERFQLEVVGGGGGVPQQVLLRLAANNGYVGVTASMQLGITGNPASFELLEVEHDLTAHSGRLVHIIARHNGKALEVPDGRAESGLGVGLGRFVAGDHQKWTLTYVGDGKFMLSNRQTGQNLDITGSQKTDGAIAVQWPKQDSDNQRFLLTPTGDGHYFIMARHSLKALDSEPLSPAPGSRVSQWALTGGASQRWKISLATTEPRPTSAIFTPVVIRDLAHLLELEVIRLRSWKNDYLIRPDTPAGVGTGPTNNVWQVGAAGGGRIFLRSWKGDYLHRPDSPPAVTTWTLTIGSEWTLEQNGATIRLRSWKGDALHRPDSPAGVTTWPVGIGNEWTVEAMQP